MTQKAQDTIKLEMTETQKCKNSPYYAYDINVFLNGVKMQNSLFNSAPAIAASRYDFAQFYLFTCGCGEPGCAGYFEYLTQEKTQDTVKYIFPKDDGFKLDKYEFEFNREQFEQEFDSLRSEMLKLEKKGIYPDSSLRNLDGYVGYEAKENESYEIKEELQEDFDWYENRFAGEEEFNKTMILSFPQLHNQSIVFKYEGNQTNPISFDYLIRRSLNQWPSKKNEVIYLKKVVKVGKLIEEVLENGNTKPLMKKINSVYKDIYTHETVPNINQVIYWVFDYEFSNFIEEKDFDVSKLTIALSNNKGEK